MRTAAELTPGLETGEQSAKVSVALAIADTHLRNQVLLALEGIPGAVVAGRCPTGSANELIAAVEILKSGIVFLGLADLCDEPAAIVARLAHLNPAPCIVAVNDCAEPDLILRVMRAGAAEFVYPPFEERFHDAVRRAIGDCARITAAQRPAGTVIGFVSAKGGCGATTLACHFADHLNLAKKNILLADLDTCSGIAGLLMQTPATYSLGDAIRNLHRMDQKLWNALVATSPSGVDVMAASPHSSDSLSATSQAAGGLSQMLRFWRTQYDLTAVDLGHGLTPSLLGTLESIDTLVLVATNELPALRQARQIIHTLELRGFGGDRLKLVVNRMPRRPQIQLQELERVMNHPICCAVADHSQALADAYAEPRLASPDSSFGKAIERMAATLTGMPVRENKGRRFFWSRQEK